MSASATAPGALMDAEIREQPTVWARLLQDGAAQIADVAGQIERRRPRFVLFAARGTSDHAALYGKYLVEIRRGLPAGLVSPSTTTAYGATPDLRDVLVVGVSQSGGSPDLVGSLAAARRGGALTVAVTNAPESALADAAELHVDVHAGSELAVAATKTYTAQLLALHLLLAGPTATTSDLPDLGRALLADDEPVREIAARLQDVQRMIVTARGYSYPTAREAALKLMETSYVSAQAFSGADLLHGPLALLDTRVPALAIVPAGPGGAAMAPVLPRLRASGAPLYCVGTPAAVAASDVGVVLPGDVPEELSPLLQILPLQQVALRLAVARGENPDAPRGLRKVTETL